MNCSMETSHPARSGEFSARLANYQNLDHKDEVLLARFVKGNVGAFDLLVKRYLGFAYATAQSYTKDVETAGDIVAISFGRAFRAAPNFRGHSRFATWLYRIIVNCAKDHIHRVTAKPTFSLDELLANDPSTELIMRPVLPETLERTTVNRGLRDRLMRAISDLPAQEQRLLMMFHRDGASYQQISTALKVPIGTVRSRLHRARANLKHKLTGATHAVSESSSVQAQAL